MTCEHCQGAEDVFDLKGAKKTLRRYQKKGPRKTTATLIEGIKISMNGSKSLLEIGGGIGAVQLELLQSGIESATGVDASSAYIQLAKEEATKKNLVEKITYKHGDFMDVKNEIDLHDVVVLDKVICCYPHMNDLLKEASGRSRHLIALVYPKTNIVGRMLIAAGNLYMRFKSNAFRVQLHSNKEVRSVINEAGFRLNYQKAVYPWNIEIYARVK